MRKRKDINYTYINLSRRDIKKFMDSQPNSGFHWGDVVSITFDTHGDVEAFDIYSTDGNDSESKPSGLALNILFEQARKFAGLSTRAYLES